MNSSIRFSVRSLMAISVTIVALVGWFSAHRNYERALAQIQSQQTLLDAACVQAAPCFEFEGMIGRSIDDYPLIQVLGRPAEVQPAPVLEVWKQKREEQVKYSFSDRFENRPDQWGKIDMQRTVTYLSLLLEDGEFEGKYHHRVMIIVQDSMIRLIMEERHMYAH
ncbi:MAG: hypothetical protein JNL67_11995 [Planctomycetaceae bacterium]|nr:hypothetical protein [Planctomycetaceae bacterium]